MTSQTIIRIFETCKGGGDIVKSMAVVFTIKEINYLVVGLFYDLVRPILYLYLWF